MLDTNQLREILGDDMDFLTQKNKEGAKSRWSGKFPGDGSPWGYGIGATLINWNYDVGNGEAKLPNINIDDERCERAFQI